jgi:Lon protease-like protein
MTVMPMFPLGSVLLPASVLSLHVFEPRYQALVTDCVAAPDHEFGVVLIDRGSEVGGGDIRREIGTVARMVQVAEIEGGRYAVIAVGTTRMRVRHWLPEDPYPRAEVEDWLDDDAPVDHDLVVAVTARTRRALAHAVELGDQVAGADFQLADDDLTVSYQLADAAPIGPADVYRLLCAAGPAARLQALATLLDDVDAVHEFRLLHP